MLIIASRVAMGSLCNVATYTPLPCGHGGVNQGHTWAWKSGKERVIYYVLSTHTSII